MPVLADPGWGVNNLIERDMGIPTYALIGRDMTWRNIDGYPGPSDIEEALAEEIPDVPWNGPPDLDPAPPEPAAVSPFSAGGDGGGAGGGSPFGGGSGCATAAARPTAAGLLGLGLLAARRRRLA